MTQDIHLEVSYVTILPCVGILIKSTARGSLCSQTLYATSTITGTCSILLHVAFALRMPMLQEESVNQKHCNFESNRFVQWNTVFHLVEVTWSGELT